MLEIVEMFISRRKEDILWFSNIIGRYVVIKMNEVELYDRRGLM